MSAYSDWKYGCISDSEYRSTCRAEYLRDMDFGRDDEVDGEDDEDK